MSENRTDHKSEADAELEREIRKDRKFSIAEAIGRLAGPGMMKGVSPVARRVQAEVEIEEYITHHLSDAGGVLPTVLIRQVKACDEFLNDFDQPLIVVMKYVRKLLDSEYLLKELVRQADFEWSQVFGERPYFEKAGCPPNPNDPYTFDSARTRLSNFVEILKSEKTVCEKS
jgi:hypothetical protein